MKIKKILQSKKYPALYLVVLENEDTFYVTAEGLFQSKLKKAEDIPPESLSKLKETSIYNELFYKAKFKVLLNTISEHKLREYMSRHSSDKVLIEKIIEELKNKNLIDDSLYAKRKYEIINRSKKDWGVNRIRNYFYKEGISNETIDSLLQDRDEDEELEKAKNEAKKYHNSLKNSNKDLYSSIYRHLIYKGFSYNNAKNAVDTILSQF